MHVYLAFTSIILAVIYWSQGHLVSQSAYALLVHVPQSASV